MIPLSCIFKVDNFTLKCKSKSMVVFYLFVKYINQRWLDQTIGIRPPATFFRGNKNKIEDRSFLIHNTWIYFKNKNHIKYHFKSDSRACVNLHKSILFLFILFIYYDFHWPDDLKIKSILLLIIMWSVKIKIIIKVYSYQYLNFLKVCIIPKK